MPPGALGVAIGGATDAPPGALISTASRWPAALAGVRQTRVGGLPAWPRMSHDGWLAAVPPPSGIVRTCDRSNADTSGSGAVAHGARIRRPSGPGWPMSATWNRRLPLRVVVPADAICGTVP